MDQAHGALQLAMSISLEYPFATPRGGINASHKSLVGGGEQSPTLPSTTTTALKGFLQNKHSKRQYSYAYLPLMSITNPNIVVREGDILYLSYIGCPKITTSPYISG
jgi:hypothetical protein